MKPLTARDLAQRGERARYHGFTLNGSERDRAVADWIDRTYDVGNAIKDLIYSRITGQRSIPAPTRTAAQFDNHYDDLIESTQPTSSAGAALLDLDD